MIVEVGQRQDEAEHIYELEVERDALRADKSAALRDVEFLRPMAEQLRVDLKAAQAEIARLTQALAHERMASEAYKNERNALENKIHDLKVEALHRAEVAERRAAEVLIATRKALAGCRAVLSRAEFSLEDSAQELGIDLDASEG